MPTDRDIDTILTSGRYRDRRGREWWLGVSMFWHEKATWKNIKRTLTGRLHDLTPDQMRLLIERDQHECNSLGARYCRKHPVPLIVFGKHSQSWLVVEPSRKARVSSYPTLAEALAAAEDLAKGQPNG